MLFQPFQILSTIEFSAGHPEIPLPGICGVLCCPEVQGLVTAGAVTVPFHQGVCLFLCTDSPALLHTETPCSPIWIDLKINHVDLRDQLSGQIFSLPCEPDRLKVLLDIHNDEALDMLNQILEMFLLSRASASPHGSPSLTGALADASACSPEMSRLYAALQAYLDQNLQQDFTAAQLAGAIGLSHRQLNALLQKNSACTTLEYVNNYRIQKAKLYLLSSNYTITEIAGLTGFKSVHYFSRVFKKITGLSPQAFRCSTPAP